MICFMSYYLPDQFVAETQSTRMITIHTLHNQFVVAFKTLSNIILEEAIKSTLIAELEVDLDKKNTKPEDTSTGKTNTSARKRFDGTKIADLIIGSTSWYNDREDDLIAAIKQIENVSQFWAVNSKLKEKTGKVGTADIASIFGGSSTF